MRKSSTWVLVVGLGLISPLAHAQSYSTSYNVTLNLGQPVYDIMIDENGSGWGGASWAYGANGSGTTTITPFFPSNLQPENSVLIGLVNNLPGDGGTDQNPVTHVVIGMDNTAASDAANIAWGTLFRNTDEQQLISNLELATSGQDFSIITPGLDAVGAFLNGDGVTGILNPDGTSQSVYFTTGSSFTMEAWSSGVVIGSGSSTVLATPEPAPMAILGLGFVGLLIRRRKRQ